MKNKKKLIISLSIIFVMILTVLGLTYAFFMEEINGEKTEVVTGQIYMNHTESSTGITLSNILPETKETALKRTDNIFTFSIEGKNTSKQDIYYAIKANYGDEVAGKNRINPKHVMLYLEEDGVPIVEGITLSSWDNQNIKILSVPAGTKDKITRNYTLRMWIDTDKIHVSDTDPKADYTTEEWSNLYASLKINVIGETGNYEDLSFLPFAEKFAQTVTLTDASTDIDGTRYVTGTNPNNYLWYSGKLWRIVAINSDNTIKLVTQGNMTTIAWSIETETVNDVITYNTVYENSQIHNWLKNEFSQTLEPSVLADSTWDYTTYAFATATKAEPTAYVENEKVGLLTIYDYYKVRNGSNSSFLKNGYYWWIMSPKTDGSGVWDVSDTGHAYYSSPTSSRGVRPSVNLKSDIQIIGGDGTKSNPYVIGGDKDIGVTSELLSNRISGEYINFNDVLYRIVGTEEIEGQTLTKITMADYSLNKKTLTTSLAFGSSSSQRIFSPTYGIGLYLEEWYQADSTSETYATTYIKDNYKAMIATATEEKVEWYTGPTSPTAPSRYDYTMAKTGTPVSATIGLGYYGEMFSSQFGDGDSSSTDTWLMTIYSSSNVWYVDDIGKANRSSPTSTHGVRASMYLKSDVKIVSGSGMPHDPYEITM